MNCTRRSDTFRQRPGGAAHRGRRAAARPRPLRRRRERRRPALPHSSARRMRTPASSRSTSPRRGDARRRGASSPAPTSSRQASSRCPSRRFQARRRRPAASPPRHALAVDAVRFVGEAVAAVVAETASAARDAVEAIVVDYEQLPAVVDVRAAIARRARRGLAPRRPTTSRAKRVTATPRPRPLRSRAPRTSSRSTSSTSARIASRSSRAPRSAPGTPRAAASRCGCSSQTPTGLRDELCDEVLGIAEGAGARAGRRRRRRLRHEDRPLSGGRRGRLRRARAPPAGQVGRPSGWRSSSPATHGRDVASRAELALDATARCSRCASIRSPTSAPTRRRRASSSSC